MRSGIERCPGCGAELGKSAVLCVMCGYDTRLGRRLKTRVGGVEVVDDEELGELPTHGNPILDAAERELARVKLEQKRLAKGAPWWMLLLAFLGLVGFAVAMVSMPQDQAHGQLGDGAAGRRRAGLRTVFREVPDHGLQGIGAAGSPGGGVTTLLCLHAVGSRGWHVHLHDHRCYVSPVRATC